MRGMERLGRTVDYDDGLPGGKSGPLDVVLEQGGWTLAIGPSGDPEYPFRAVATDGNGNSEGYDGPARYVYYLAFSFFRLAVAAHPKTNHTDDEARST